MLNVECFFVIASQVFQESSLIVVQYGVVGKSPEWPAILFWLRVIGFSHVLCDSCLEIYST